MKYLVSLILITYNLPSFADDVNRLNQMARQKELLAPVECLVKFSGGNDGGGGFLNPRNKPLGPEEYDPYRGGRSKNSPIDGEGRDPRDIPLPGYDGWKEIIDGQLAEVSFDSRAEVFYGFDSAKVSDLVKGTKIAIAEQINQHESFGIDDAVPVSFRGRSGLSDNLSEQLIESFLRNNNVAVEGCWRELEENVEFQVQVLEVLKRLIEEAYTKDESENLNRFLNLRARLTGEVGV